MTPRLSFAGALLAASLATAPALAADPPRASLDMIAPAALSETDLDQSRGGFATPLGFDIGFGAEVSTYVDGQLALRTRLTWTSEGAVKTVEAGQLTPDLIAKAAVQGLHLQPAEGSGVLIDGKGGATAILHELDATHIASLVVNNASNRDIRQDTAISLDLPDFAAMQQNIQAAQTQLRIQSALGMALRDAGR